VREAKSPGSHKQAPFGAGPVELRPLDSIPPRLLARLAKAVAPGGDRRLRAQYRGYLSKGLSHEGALEAVARSTFLMPRPNTDVIIKDNPAHYVTADATAMLAAARRARRKHQPEVEARFARAAILLFGLGLEAFVNFVYIYSGARTNRSLKRLKARDRWLKASLECMPPQGNYWSGSRVVYKPGDPVQTFDPTSSLFRLYLELKRIRDDFAHLTPTFRVVEAHSVRRAIRQVARYPITKIPRDISLWRAHHAVRASQAFSRLVRTLDRFMKGSVRGLLAAPGLVEFIITSYPGKKNGAA
jgi:hypothetical protein